jgi:hypothetical protein
MSATLARTLVAAIDALLDFLRQYPFGLPAAVLDQFDELDRRVYLAAFALGFQDALPSPQRLERPLSDASLPPLQFLGQTCLSGDWLDQDGRRVHAFTPREERIFYYYADDGWTDAMLTLRTLAMSAAGQPGNRQLDQERLPRRHILRAEAEVLVRDWLEENAKEKPASITRDAVSAGTGVSTGMVSRTAAWKAFRDRRDAGKKPASRDVSLSGAMLTTIPADCARPDQVAELVEEQNRERAEEERRHRRRHTPS